jgi:hypothetical protein
MQPYFKETMSYPAANKLKDQLEQVWRKAKGPHSLIFAKARILRQGVNEKGADTYVIRSNVTFDDLGYFIVQHQDHGIDANGMVW